MNPRSSGLQVKMPIVVSTAPTKVTNMTGFLIISRGSSFLNESPIAGPTMFQSNREGAFCVIKVLEQFSLKCEEVLDDRPERQNWQKVQRADQQYRAEQQHDESPA